MRPRWRTCAGAAALALMVLAGCGDDDDDDAQGSGTTTTSESETTATTTAQATTTTLSAEGEVLRDYGASIVAFSGALNPPDPDDPDLPAHYAGSALTQVQDRIRSLRAQGVGAINTVDSHPTVASLSGDVAVVEDCFIDRTQLVQLATGQAGTPDETIAFLTSRMEQIDNVWKVVERTGREEPCQPG